MSRPRPAVVLAADTELGFLFELLCCRYGIYLEHRVLDISWLVNLYSMDGEVCFRAYIYNVTKRYFHRFLKHDKSEIDWFVSFVSNILLSVRNRLPMPPYLVVLRCKYSLCLDFWKEGQLSEELKKYPAIKRLSERATPPPGRG